MPAGHRHRVDRFLAQLVGELAQLAGLELAQVGRRFGEIEQGGFGRLGHRRTPRQAEPTSQAPNLRGWSQFNQIEG
jgi:hypothetical protein